MVSYHLYFSSSSPFKLFAAYIPIKMKYSAAIALAAVSGSSAYSVNRSTLRSLGQKNVGVTARPQKRVNANEMKMEGKFFMYCIVTYNNCNMISQLI